MYLYIKALQSSVITMTYLANGLTVSATIQTSAQKFCRIVNEIPTILLILIVVLATAKPF